MASPDFVIKQNDTLSPLTATLKDAVGVVDLTNTSGVKLHLVSASDDSVKINAAATVDSDPTTGKISYAWIADDTDTAGEYRAEFEVTFSDGLVQTFPNNGNLWIRIEGELA